MMPDAMQTMRFAVGLWPEQAPAAKGEIVHPMRKGRFFGLDKRPAESALAGEVEAGRLILLTGDTRSRQLLRELQKHGIGRMFIDHVPTPYPGEPWGFDNGAFRDWRNGRKFDGDAYLCRLEKAYAVGRPYIAIVPDLVAGGLRSLEFSLRWLEKLPANWPWYLAVQDGMTLADVESVLDKFTGLFLGGTDIFKGTAWHWCRLAHQHGKKFHFARAGTLRKIAYAKEIGADSSDSAFPLWTKERLGSFIQMWQTGPRQLQLWGPEVGSVEP